MFGILGWIVFGLVVGAIAKLLMPVRDPGGFIVTILLGIVGAVLGGWMARTMGMYGPNEPAGFIMALIGAVVLLAIYRMAMRPQTSDEFASAATSPPRVQLTGNAARHRDPRRGSLRHRRHCAGGRTGSSAGSPLVSRIAWRSSRSARSAPRSHLGVSRMPGGFTRPPVVSDQMRARRLAQLDSWRG
jgi:uncharacterized membrane protein YeaQ/YmgE (transglycosylase-associated protein family)